MRNGEWLQAIDYELKQERVSCLRRVAERLQRLLAELSALEQTLPALESAELERALARHEHLRREAEHQRWCLLVQREAMGLRHHQAVDEHYPVPRRLKR